MILEAAEKYNIALCDSWMVGDDKRDILAGRAAGCKTVLISDPGPEYEANGSTARPDYYCESLTRFAGMYLS
jgi:phosphoglycolate phosphatase-like HAD superfamily hydrolase